MSLSTGAEHPSLSRRAIRLLIMVTLIGFALRLGWLLVAQPAAVSDALGYKSLANRWVTEGLYERFHRPTAWRTPGYIGFLGLGILVSPSELWLGFLNVVAASTVVPLTAVLTRRLGLSNRTALIAAGLTAMMPPLVLWAPVLGPENVQTPLLLLGLILATGSATSRRRVLWCGVVFGIALLVRPESAVYLPVVALAMWAGDHHAERRTILRRTVAVGAVAVVMCVPWVVRNHLQVGPVGTSSVGGVNFYLAHRDDGYGFEHYEYTALAGLDEVEMSQRGYELGMQTLRDDPASLLGDVAEGTQRLYGPPGYAAYFSSRAFSERGPYPLNVGAGTITSVRTFNLLGWYSIAALSVVGWMVLILRRHRAAAAVTAMVVANWACFTVVFWALARYRFPVEPILCMCAAVALSASSIPRATLRGAPMDARATDASGSDPASRRELARSSLSRNPAGPRFAATGDPPVTGAPR